MNMENFIITPYIKVGQMSRSQIEKGEMKLQNGAQKMKRGEGASKYDNVRMIVDQQERKLGEEMLKIEDSGELQSGLC